MSEREELVQLVLDHPEITDTALLLIFDLLGVRDRVEQEYNKATHA